MHVIRAFPVALILLVLPGTPHAATVTEALPLAAGEFRVSLPSPDGQRLAVLAGPGKPGAPHSVVVVEHPCGGGATRVLAVDAKARFDAQPDRVPQDIVRLAWSPDGSQLYAAGTVYALREADGALAADRLMHIERPLLDFRFGPGNNAAGVELVAASERETGTGPKWIIEVEYTLYRLTREVRQVIPPRENKGNLWVPLDWGDGPLVGWDADSVVLYYPYHTITERFIPGKAREQLDSGRPNAPLMASAKEWKLKDPCRITWKLVQDGGVDAVEITTR